MRRRVRFADVVSVLALFVALGGTSYAALKIRGKDVVNSSLTGADVRNGSIGTADVAGLRAADFARGELPVGPTGAPGAPGAKGDKGEKGDRGDAGPAGASAIDTALPGARMSAEGNTVTPVTVPSGIGTIAMDHETFDTGDMYTAPDDVMTVRRTGTYIVTAQLQITGGGNRQLRLLVDGAIREVSEDLSGASRATLQLATTLRLQAGATLGLGTFTTAAGNITAFTNTEDVWLAAQFVGP